MADTYSLLDAGGGRRLEQWGPVRTVRPDQRAIGVRVLENAAWGAADAVFEGRVGQGAWRTPQPVPDAWSIAHAGLRFELRLAPSMHTGLFPEQSQHWAWMRSAHGPTPLDVLNLFAYTGGASAALAALGHRVTHVDASRPAIGWAKRNAALNGLDTIRWIADDVQTFVARERKRGRRYGGLLLDPPAFGRAGGNVWRLDHDLDGLLDAVCTLLTPDARFVLVNVYDLATTAASLAGRLADALDTAQHPLSRRSIDAGSLDLRTLDGRALPTGCFARVAAR